jgi:DNA-directed RNA polymerase specialized sigma24 family protein
VSAEEILRENNRRLDILHRTKNDWLMKVSYNLTSDVDEAKDLVSELYLYVAEKGNPNIWWGEDGYNMMYLFSFLKSRYINGYKQSKKLTRLKDNFDLEDIPYDEDLDKIVQQTYDEVVKEITDLQQTKMWSSARLAEIYLFDDTMTLEKLSNEIGISKSTSFLNVKKIKKHMKKKYQNPFRSE